MLEGPKSITPEDFDAAYDELDQVPKETPRDSEMVSEDGQEVLEGQVYDFEKLERIDKGLAPVSRMMYRWWASTPAALHGM